MTEKDGRVEGERVHVFGSGAVDLREGRNLSAENGIAERTTSAPFLHGRARRTVLLPRREPVRSTSAFWRNSKR